MAPFQSFWIISFLYAALLLDGSLLVDANEDETSRNGSESVLEQFIEDSLKQVGDASTGQLAYHLSDNVDTIAQFLNIGIDLSQDLQGSIAKAVHLDELLEEDQTTSASPTSSFTATTDRHFVPPSRRPGLLGLLDPQEQNPHIVHARRSVDFDKLIETTFNFLERLPRDERNFLEQVSEEVVFLEDNGKKIDLGELEPTTGIKPRGSRVRALMRLTATVCQRGIDALDRFYQAPDFIMNIPIIGEQLRELKKKGEPLLKRIKFLRHSIYLLKFMPLNPNRASLESLSEAERERLNEAKKMISEVGAIALKSVAFKIISRYANKVISEEATQVIISRTFFAILGKILTFGK